MGLEITRIETTELEYAIDDVGPDPKGFSLTYDPGNELRRRTFGLRIHTDAGITGVMKTARVAEGFGVDVELHGPGPVQRHCMAAVRNSNYYELALVHRDCANTHPPVYAEGYGDELSNVADDGTVAVPDGPGLGVEYNWSFIEASRTGGQTYE